MRQLPFMFLLAGSLVACVDQGTTDEAAQVSSDLEKANGGLDTADEAPMFGAQAEFDAAAIEADTATTDTMATDPSVTAMAGGPNAAGHDLLVLWGKLPGQPGAQDARDWTGSLSLSRGALVVRRTVAFEDATDHVLPRTSPQSVGFQSVTRPFVDGLALRVIDPDVTATGPLTLTYASAQTSATYTFDLSLLATGPIVIDAGDGFKMVAIAHRPDNGGCAGGFMRGRWRALTAGMGVYHGIVANRLGEPVGHIRGIYGHRKDGTPVMFGKFIDVQGHFLGLLVGSYDGGEFHAQWKEAGDTDHGKIHGAYFEAPVGGRGAFVARWAETACTQD